jgi:hypothetical protein
MMKKFYGSMPRRNFRSCSNDISFRIDYLTEEQQNQIAAVDAYFYSLYEKLKRKDTQFMRLGLMQCKFIG